MSTKMNQRAERITSTSASLSSGIRTKAMAAKKNESTGKKAATAAAKVIHDPKASKAAKTAAASTLTQKPDKPASKPKAKSKATPKTKKAA